MRAAWSVVFVAIALLIDHWLLWICLVASMLALGPAISELSRVRAMWHKGRAHSSRIVFVVTPCKEEPARLQWTRIEYRNHGLQRTETIVDAPDRRHP